MSESTSAQKPLTISTVEKGSVTILRLTGDLDNQSLATAKEALQILIDSGRLQIIFDLEEVGYIDSSGLGFFIGSLKSVKQKKGNVKLARLNAYMLGIFKLIHLDYVLEIHEDLEAALASFPGQANAGAAS